MSGSQGFPDTVHIGRQRRPFKGFSHFQPSGSKNARFLAFGFGLLDMPHSTGICIKTKVTYAEALNARDMVFALCDLLTDPKQIMEYVRTGCEIVYVWDERLEG